MQNRGKQKKNTKFKLTFWRGCLLVNLHAHACILHQCDGVKDHTTRGRQQKNTGGWVLFKGGAGVKRGAPCCAVNHSLCVLGAVDRCRALVLR